MFKALQKKMSQTVFAKTGTSASSSAPVTRLRLNLDFETTPCRPSPSWTHSSDASEDDDDDDAYSETSTLVDSPISPVNRITTAFQETDPEVREAIYQEYLAYPSIGNVTDDQELDSYNTSWAHTPSKRSRSRRSSRGTESDLEKKGWRIRFRV